MNRIYIKRKYVVGHVQPRRAGNTEVLVRFIKKHARHYDRVIVSCLGPFSAEAFRRRVGNICIDTHECYMCSQDFYPCKEKCLYVVDDFDCMNAKEQLNCMTLAQRVEVNGGTSVILNG